MQSREMLRDKLSSSSDKTALGVALALPFVFGAIGGAATDRSVNDWYKTVKKPGWNPPSWLFGPVWTVLFFMMGAASWLIWREGNEAKSQPESASQDADKTAQASRSALKLYGVKLLFNALWSVIFFGMRRIGWAFAEIVALWSLIVATATRFYQIKPVAGLLMIPYALWATFAAVLNFTIWRLNRS